MRRIKLFTSRYHKTLLMALVVSAAGLLFGLAGQTASAACDPGNDIISCGFTSKAGFISTINQHPTLVHIYSAYGLEPADYDRFVSSAVAGYAYKDNTIRVNGKVVATNVDSIGRNKAEQGSGAFTQTIDGGGTFYGNTNDKAFATSPLPVHVLLDAKGNVQFAVIDSCGNPIGAPNYSCNTLNESAVAGTNDTFSFSSNVTANSTAKLSKVVYSFGDGTSITETNPAKVVTHKYAKSGTYTASVAVYISLPHAPDVVITAKADCIKKVIVNIPPPPVYMCVSLTDKAINESHYSYTFVVTGRVANGAKLHSADFNFGDKAVANGIIATGNTVTKTHNYDSNIKAVYTVVATLHIDLPGGKSDTVTAAACQKKVSVNVPLYSCDSLSGTLIDEQTHKFNFVATAGDYQYVTFKNVQFDFGDNSPVVTATPNSDMKTATTDHAYAAAGNYTATATLNFNDGKKAVSVKCTSSVTPTQIVPPCTPGTPPGGSTTICNPCPSNSAVSADSSECVLPNTGAGDVIGIAGVAAVIGFFVYRQFIARKRVASSVAGAALTGAHAPQQAHAKDDNELTAHVIAHRQAPEHRNAQGLNHTAYHKPHRFRPRSHKDK